MHEFSIARSIVDIAEEAVTSREGRSVERIILDIGRLSGIELDALTFVWEAATKESVLEGAERIINTIPARAKCLECEQEFEPAELMDACPHCGSYFYDILKGKEMQVRSLVIVK
jgi:hydrogenase nickel incorporation protein HypA/HybF